MFDSILVVCTGNICRSPIGERYLRNLLPNKKIDSAGTGALIEHAADNSAIKVAQIHGLSLEGHNSRQFTSSLGRQYDLILAMEKSHIEQIGHIAPEVKGKTMLFGHWLEQRIYLILIVKVTKPSYQFINLLSRPVNFGLKN
jgi:protein-tyrosine phosphatase